MPCIDKVTRELARRARARRNIPKSVDRETLISMTQDESIEYRLDVTEISVLIKGLPNSKIAVILTDLHTKEVLRQFEYKLEEVLKEYARNESCQKVQ